MLDLLIEMFEGAIQSAVDFFNNPYTSIAELVFYADEHLAKRLGATGLASLSRYMLYTGYLLILIKFLMKGFQQYILQTEGDPDASPLALGTRFIKALVIAVSFPTFYEWGAEIAMDIIEKAVDTLAGVRSISFTEAVLLYLKSGSGFMWMLAGVTFVIIYILLYIQFIRRGLEVLILKVGVSWSCVGILDSDEELYKNYIRKFFHSFNTALAQLILLKFGIALLFKGEPIWAVAALSASLSTPKLIQELMVRIGGEGGGLMNKAYYAGNLARSIGSFLRR